MRNGSGMSRRRLLGTAVGSTLIALLIAFQFGFVSLSKRVQGEDILGDLRWPLASATLKAARANLPFGTGFGTFVPVYQTVEPRTLLMETYVNRAHDDWLEMVLEGGALSIFGMVVFLVWFAHSSWRAWRPGGWGTEPLSAGWARAGSIVGALLMLHSVVDYPLRTSALMVVFALSCALMIPPKRLSAAFGSDQNRPRQMSY